MASIDHFSYAQMAAEVRALDLQLRALALQHPERAALEARYKQLSLRAQAARQHLQAWV